MRLDIPQEQPRRREGNDAAPGSSDGRVVTRKPPDNPVLRRLKSLEQRTADHRQQRPQTERKRVEQPHDVPQQRRRPVASADPRRPARSTGNIVGLELRSEEKQLLREAGRFRVVRTADLRDTLYNGKSRPLENDLRYLRDKGLVETTHINLRRDGQRRTIERAEVVTLTKDGLRLLLKRATSPKTSGSTPVWSSRARPSTTPKFTAPIRRKPTHRGQGRHQSARASRLRDKSGRAESDLCRAKGRPEARHGRDQRRSGRAVRAALRRWKIQIPDARIDYDLPREEGRMPAKGPAPAMRT